MTTRVLIGSSNIIYADESAAGGAVFILQAGRVVDLPNDALAQSWIASGLATSSSAALNLPPDAVQLHGDEIQSTAYVRERTAGYPFGQASGADALCTEIADAWGWTQGQPVWNSQDG